MTATNQLRQYLADNAQYRRILRLPQVMAVTGFGRSWIYQAMSEGRFPQSRKTGPRAVGWDSQAIERWIAERLDGEV